MSDQRHDPYAAWRYRNYTLFAIARNLLMLGSQMQSVAIGWELYERTSSALISDCSRSSVNWYRKDTCL
jgi:hypothetical protein